MRLILAIILSLALSLHIIATATPANAAPISAAGSVEVYFSPKGGATEAVVAEIDKAQSEILIQAYSFTSTPIAKALVQAHKRGVKVIAVLDKSQRSAKYTSATFLTNAGIPVYIDNKHAIAHNKIIVIDRLVLITGSFNFTKAAEQKNAENLLVIKGNKPLVQEYLHNFELHEGHSDSFSKK